MTLEFLPEARGELLESISYYEAREPGLGTRFRMEVANVVDRLA